MGQFLPLSVCVCVWSNPADLKDSLRKEQQSHIKLSEVWRALFPHLACLRACRFEEGGVDQALGGRIQKCRIHLKFVVPLLHGSQSVLELAQHTSDWMSASSNP